MLNTRGYQRLEHRAGFESICFRNEFWEELVREPISLDDKVRLAGESCEHETLEALLLHQTRRWAVIEPRL